jgi:diadenosine tetraphosphate (Ap4A) HIT family hydrolase
MFCMNMKDNGTVYESAHWRLKQRGDAKLPGYLILATKIRDADSLHSLPIDAQQELGMILAKAVHVLETTLGARLAYVSRWGHIPGLVPHFPIMPLYPWVEEAYVANPAYGHPDADGPMYSLFITREFIESETPPDVHGPSVAETIRIIRSEFTDFGK